MSFLCIGCDQSSKNDATEHLPGNGQADEPVDNLGDDLTDDTINSASSDLGIDDTLRLIYTENTGAFPGPGGNLPENTRFAIFTVLVGLFLSAFLLYLVFSTTVNALSLAALRLVLSVDMSNFIDRLLNNGAVVDFLNVRISSFRTGIFSIADVAI